MLASEFEFTKMAKARKATVPQVPQVDQDRRSKRVAVKVQKQAKIDEKEMLKQRVAEKREKARLLSKAAHEKNRQERLTREALAEHDKSAEGGDVRRMDRIYDRKFEGNDDEKGSVDSGALDENVCFECGLDTTHDVNESIIICDSCSAEYHITCAKVVRESRAGNPWTCSRCVQDENFFDKLRYDIVVKNWDGKKQRVEFEISRSKKVKASYCFSPSRPLEEAWKECQNKGFMVVSKVFDYNTLKLLTHGEVQMKTMAGRVAKSWTGALDQISEQVRLGVMTNLIYRGGRYDLRLSDDLVRELSLDAKLEPILAKLRTIMGPHPLVRTHNVVFCPVGSECQKWHFDDTKTKLKKERYFTILIPLNLIDENGGGTEVWSKPLNRGDMVRQPSPPPPQPTTCPLLLSITQHNIISLINFLNLTPPVPTDPRQTWRRFCLQRVPHAPRAGQHGPHAPPVLLLRLLVLP